MVDRQLNFSCASRDTFIDDIKSVFTDDGMQLLRDACGLLDSCGRYGGIELGTESHDIEVEACGRELLRMQPELLEAECIYKILDVLNMLMHRPHQSLQAGCTPTQQLVSLLLMIASLNSHSQRSLLIDEALDSELTWQLVKDFHFKCISEQASAVGICDRNIQRRFFFRWRARRRSETATTSISILSSSVASKQNASLQSRATAGRKAKHSTSILPQSQLSPFGMTRALQAAHSPPRSQNDDSMSHSGLTPSIRILDELSAATLNTAVAESNSHKDPSSENRSKLSHLSQVLEGISSPSLARNAQFCEGIARSVQKTGHYDPRQQPGVRSPVIATNASAESYLDGNPSIRSTHQQIIASSSQMMADSNSRLDLLLEGVKDAAAKAAGRLETSQNSKQTRSSPDGEYTPSGKEIEVSECQASDASTLRQTNRSENVSRSQQMMSLDLLGDIKDLLRQSDRPTSSVPAPSSKRVVFATEESNQTDRHSEFNNSWEHQTRLHTNTYTPVLNQTADYISRPNSHDKSVRGISRAVYEPILNQSADTSGLQHRSVISDVNPTDARLRALRATTEFQITQPKRKLNNYFKRWRKTFASRRQAVDNIKEKINKRLESKYFMKWAEAAEDEQQLRERYEANLKLRLLNLWRRRALENQTADAFYEHTLRLTHINIWRKLLYQKVSLRKYDYRRSVCHLRLYFMKWKLISFLVVKNHHIRKDVFNCWRTKSKVQQIERNNSVRPTWEAWKVKYFQRRTTDRSKRVIFDYWRADTFRNRTVVANAWVDWRDALETQNYLRELNDTAISIDTTSTLKKMMLLWSRRYRQEKKMRLLVEAIQNKKKLILRKQLFYRWHYRAWDSAVSTEVQQQYNRKLVKKIFVVLQQELLTPKYLRSAESSYQHLCKLRVFAHWRRMCILNKMCDDNSIYFQQSTLRAGFESWKVMLNRKLMMRVADSMLWRRNDRKLKNSFSLWRQKAYRVNQLSETVSAAQYNYNLQLRCFLKWSDKFRYFYRIRESEDQIATTQSRHLIRRFWKLWRTKYLLEQRTPSSKKKHQSHSVPSFWGAAR